MSKEYSPEARRFALTLWQAIVDASKAYPGDLAATQAAVNVVRDQLVCQLIDQHGRAQAQPIVDDALALSQRLVDALAEHWGMRTPPAA